MCFASSAQKTAEKYYEEMKVDPEALPSLMMDKKKRSDVKLGDVPKPISGNQSSSLLTALKSSY